MAAPDDADVIRVYLEGSPDPVVQMLREGPHEQWHEVAEKWVRSQHPDCRYAHLHCGESNRRFDISPSHR